jgi:hypothetical protein
LAFAGQNIVSINTGTLTGTYRVGYSLRYRMEDGTNQFRYRVANTASNLAGVGLAEMIEHDHSQNLQPADRFHSSGFFTIVLNGTPKILTLQCRSANMGTSSRIGYDDARLEMWKVGS